MAEKLAEFQRRDRRQSKRAHIRELLREKRHVRHTVHAEPPYQLLLGTRQLKPRHHPCELITQAPRVVVVRNRRNRSGSCFCGGLVLRLCLLLRLA
jgi:hypothetical protein